MATSFQNGSAAINALIRNPSTALLSQGETGLTPASASGTGSVSPGTVGVGVVPPFSQAFSSALTQAVGTFHGKHSKCNVGPAAEFWPFQTQFTTNVSSLSSSFAASPIRDILHSSQLCDQHRDICRFGGRRNIRDRQRYGQRGDGDFDRNYVRPGCGRRQYGYGHRLKVMPLNMSGHVELLDVFANSSFALADLAIVVDDVDASQYFTILNPSSFSTRRRRGSPCGIGSGWPFISYARIVWDCRAVSRSITS